MPIIEPRLDAVFIQVSDMARAIDWYTRLLGLPAGEISHEGHIHELPLASAAIILDGHAHARGMAIASEGVRFMVTATNLGAVVEHAQSLGTPVSQPEDIGSVTVSYVDDPDGNRICVKSPNQ